jgi:hypothetical protein
MDSQRDSADSGRINDLERRLGLVEVRQGAIERSREVMKVVVPAETRRHMRAAWRENLLAVRSLLDTWIDRLDDDQSGGADDDGRETIPID